MKISDSIRVEPIFDHKHGRRFQIIVVNKEKNDSFTVQHDLMAREYVKLKLNEAEILQLIEELNKNFQSLQSDPKVLELQARKTRLKVIPGKDEE